MRSGWVVLALVAVGTGCSAELSSGAWGTFRYFGEVSGEVPMRLLPPMTDRAGHVYVLNGARDRSDHEVIVGDPAGGWTRGCTVERGDSTRGFVGRSADRAWYWAGDALVEVDGATGACAEVMSTDPVTNTELRFVGVAPRVAETPSRRYLAALLRGGADPQPFLVRLDLDQRRYTSVIELDDEDAEVIGVGADPYRDEAVFVLTHGSGGEVIVADATGDAVLRRFEFAEALEPYSVLGFVRFASDGLGAGLLEDGRVLLVSAGTARVVEPGVDVHGVQVLDDALYLTGLSGGRPSLFQISASGVIDSGYPWAAAELAAIGLEDGVEVLDERSSPASQRSWNRAVSAIGTHPLLTPWPLDVYTVASTGWLVAGPSFASTPEPRTAVAFAPMGLTP